MAQGGNQQEPPAMFPISTGTRYSPGRASKSADANDPRQSNVNAMMTKKRACSPKGSNQTRSAKSQPAKYREEVSPKPAPVDSRPMAAKALRTSGEKRVCANTQPTASATPLAPRLVECGILWFRFRGDDFWSHFRPLRVSHRGPHRWAASKLWPRLNAAAPASPISARWSCKVRALIPS